MTVIHRTALVEFSACQMYDLVNDISAYPEFLPMCAQVDVHSQSATEAEATLSIVKGAIKIEFATHNDMIKNQEITIRLIKGPFKHLTGVWKFVPLSAIIFYIRLSVMDFNRDDFIFKISLIDCIERFLMAG